MGKRSFIMSKRFPVIINDPPNIVEITCVIHHTGECFADLNTLTKNGKNIGENIIDMEYLDEGSIRIMNNFFENVPFNVGDVMNETAPIYDWWGDKPAIYSFNRQDTINGRVLISFDDPKTLSTFIYVFLLHLHLI